MDATKDRSLTKKLPPMKSHCSSPRLFYPFALIILLYPSVVFAQNEGIGTFSDLVGEAREAAPQPQPTAVTVVMTQAGPGMKMFAVPLPTPTPTAPSLFAAPTVGLEYDYRRNQQKGPDGLTTDVNEIHTPSSFALATTKFAFDYFHVWSDGFNDIGAKQSVTSNGLKLTLTQPISQWLTFSLPMAYKSDDGDAVTSTGPQTFSSYSYTAAPLLIFSIQPPLLKDNAGNVAKDQPVTLLLSPGYVLRVSEKNHIQPLSPDVDGWTGTLNLLAGVEYAPKTEKGDNKWKVSGTVTWSHLTNYYSSKVGPRPDDNGLGLGLNVACNLLTFKDSKDKYQPKLTVRIGYQYDGFNRDAYQHTATAGVAYRFW
jgi:hypothetical protein